MEVVGIIVFIVFAAAVWAWRDARAAIALDEADKRRRAAVINQPDKDQQQKPQLVSVLRNVTVDQRADLSALDDGRWN